MSGDTYKWNGADGGSWTSIANWLDGNGDPATAAPGSTDLAEFVSFSGTVTGGFAAQILDIGPGSAVTLDGSGAFGFLNVGQDLAANVGDASLTIATGGIVAATLLSLGSALGGNGTLTADGILSASGGIVMDQTGVAGKIVVDNGGAVYDGASLTMAAGGQIQIGASGQMVIGDSSGGGTNGALTIDKNFFFDGEGTIAANVIVNGNLETFNAGWPANTLTVTGDVTGSGTVSVVQELDLDGAVGAGVTISLFGNGGSNAGLLRLAKPLADAGTLATMSTGSVIALTGLTFDEASWSPGELTITGASGTLILKTSGDHSFQHFIAKPDAISGTDIIVENGPGLTIGVADDTGSKDNPPVTKDDTIKGGGTGGAVVHFKVDGVAIATTVTADALGNWSFTPTGLADGTHTIVASEKDSGGNTMTATITFTLDTHAPAAPVIAKAALAGGVWTLSGTAEPGAKIAIYDGASKLVGAATAGASGAWTFKTNRNASAVGYFTAVAIDRAGNMSTHSPALVEGTTGKDAIAWTHGGARIVGRGGGDSMTASGHASADTFVYLQASDSLNKAGAFDAIAGFADKGNGKAFNDVLDLSAIKSLTRLQGALGSATRKVAAHSVAFLYNAGANETFVYANTGSKALSLTSASLMEIGLVGGDFRLGAGNFHLA